jgi:hypothetical protein
MCFLGREQVIFPHSRFNPDAMTVYKAIFYLYDKYERETLPGYMDLQSAPSAQSSYHDADAMTDSNSENVVDSEMHAPSPASTEIDFSEIASTEIDFSEIASTEIDFSEIESEDQIRDDVTMDM